MENCSFVGQKALKFLRPSYFRLWEKIDPKTYFQVVFKKKNETQIRILIKRLNYICIEEEEKNPLMLKSFLITKGQIEKDQIVSFLSFFSFFFLSFFFLSCSVFCLSQSLSYSLSAPLSSFLSFLKCRIKKN
jgi:hypothetical protein